MEFFFCKFSVACFCLSENLTGGGTESKKNGGPGVFLVSGENCVLFLGFVFSGLSDLSSPSQSPMATSGSSHYVSSSGNDSDEPEIILGNSDAEKSFLSSNGFKTKKGLYFVV